LSKRTGAALWVAIALMLWGYFSPTTGLAQDEYTFLRAAAEGDIDTLKEFLYSGGDINTTGERNETALHSAVFQAHVEVVKFLLAESADPNIADSFNQTPIFPAITNYSEHSKDIIRLLLDYGADPNITEEVQGQSPLMIAAYYNHPKIVSLLMEQGADTQLSDKEGRTALDIAQAQGNDEIVSLLMSAPGTEGGRETDTQKRPDLRERTRQRAR